jgi:BTG family
VEEGKKRKQNERVNNNFYEYTYIFFFVRLLDTGKKKYIQNTRKKRSFTIMKVEINTASDFLMNLLRVRQQTLTETQLHSFRGSLITVLHEKFRDHWYTENPRKGKSLDHKCK